MQVIALVVGVLAIYAMMLIIAFVTGFVGPLFGLG